jgi:hypothetical protein
VGEGLIIVCLSSQLSRVYSIALSLSVRCRLIGCYSLIVARVYTTILTTVPYTRTWYLARVIQFFDRVFTFICGRDKSGPYGGRDKSGPYGDVSWVGF